MRGFVWSADEDEQLIRLAAQNLSAREIGLAMNKSKNAILGRAARLRTKFPGLEVGNPECFWTKGQKEGLRRKKEGLPRKSRKHICEQSRERQRAAKRAEAAAHPKIRTAAMAAVDAAKIAATKRRNAERRQAMKTQTSEHAVHILDRNMYDTTTHKAQCAWPLWCDAAPFSELMCCGGKTEAGSSYCPAHAYRASNWVKGAFVRQPGYFKSWVNTGRAA